VTAWSKYSARRKPPPTWSTTRDQQQVGEEQLALFEVVQVHQPDQDVQMEQQQAQVDPGTAAVAETQRDPSRGREGQVRQDQPNECGGGNGSPLRQSCSMAITQRMTKPVARKAGIWLVFRRRALAALRCWSTASSNEKLVSISETATFRFTEPLTSRAGAAP
jgi:hypothetical protein